MFSKLLKNTGFLIVARLTQPFFSFILIIVMARFSGSELLGGFSIVISYIAVFQTVAAFGFKYLLTREVAGKPEIAGKYLVHTIYFSIPVGLLCSTVMYAAGVLLNYDGTIQLALALAGFILITTTLIENCEGVFIGIENIKPYTFITFLENLLRVLISVFAIINGFGLIELIEIMICTRFLGFAANVLILRRLLTSISFKFDFPFGLKLLKSAKTFALIVILAAIYSKTDILFLSKFRPASDVGLYSASLRFITAAQLILAGFGNSLYPHLTRLYEESGDKFSATCNYIIHHLIQAVIPVIIITVLCADKIIILLFGAEFKESVFPLQILAVSLLPFAFITVGDYILLSSYNQENDLKINFFSVISAVTLNTLLIPSYGIKGAATAVLLSTFIYIVIQNYYISRYVIKIKLFEVLGKPLLAGIIMAVTFIFLNKSNIFLATGVSLLVYILITGGMRRILK